MDRKNIVVTGGAGFIGSHLCERLLKGGDHVICIDNLNGGSESNINQLLVHPNFEFLKHDVNEPFDLESFPELQKFAIRAKGIQQIYNAACPTSPKDFLHLRKDTLRTNSVGIQNVLEVAVRYQAKFVQCSSSVVYGPRKPEIPHISESEHGDVDVLSQRANYDEGKRFAETCVATYQHIYRIDAKIARIFRTYGPRMPINQGHMIPDFILSALEDKPLLVFGSKDFSTSLLYIDDLIDGLLRLMESPFTTEPINFGTEEDYPITSIAEAIITLTKSNSTISYKEPLLFMSALGLPDITHAKETLGWLPLHSMEHGLKKTIEYAMAERGLLHSST